jgi:uncharacterized protein (DUF885 family)
MRSAFLVAAGFLAAWPLLAWAGPDDETEDARLEALFRRYLEATFQARPLYATRLGDHRFDHLLDDLSPAARRANLDRDRATLKELDATVRLDTLSIDGRVDREIFRSDLLRSIWLQETFDPYADDPRVWGEAITESVYLLLTQSTEPREANVRNAAARMEAIPGVIAVARSTIGNPPRVMTETAIAQTRGAIEFYRGGIREEGALTEAEWERLRGPAEAVRSALEGHLAFLENEVLPRSEADSWRIGRERFAKKLELELDAGLTADEVLAEAEREAERVTAEMAFVARQLWSELFPGTIVPTDDPEGRAEAIRRVIDAIGEDRSSAGTVVDDVKATADEVKAFISRARVLALPEPDKCAIIEMPEFMRGNSTAYLNPAPPLDPRGRSEYAVSPPPAHWTPERVESYFREYNRQMLRILTIHEAYPGHYVQLEYSNRCPSFLRRVLQSGTFAEGWAVYTEQMMLDQGYGGGDLRLRMMQLKFYLRAVVNAILDHRMHCTEMTDEDAMALLTVRAFQTEGEAAGKVVRAKQSSAQLSTYFVGRTAFYRLRQRVQRAMGDQFDLARFHEAVLAHGTVPVRHLPALVGRDLGLADER